MEIPVRNQPLQKEQNDYQQSLHTSLQKLQLLTERNSDQLGYIQIMQDFKDKFTNPAFLVPDFARVRIEFFKQLSYTVLTFAYRCQNEDLKSIDDYRSKIKFPVTILCIVYSQMLEVKEVLSGDFLMLLNNQFGNLAKPKIYIPYLVILSLLLHEIDYQDIDSIEDSDNTLKNTSETSEESTIIKITLSKKAIYNFFHDQALDLLNFSTEALITLSQPTLTNESSQLLELPLRIATKIIQCFNLKSQEFKNFASNNYNSLKIILSSFLLVLKSSTSNKQEYLRILSNMLKFIENLIYPLNISQHYDLVSENLQYISNYFSSSNDLVEYFDFNMLCMEFLLSIKQHYIKKDSNIQDYPIVIELFKQSSRLNLINYENQINCLRLWTHYQEFILHVYDSIEGSFTTDLSQITCLHPYFLEQLQYNKNFLLTVVCNSNEFLDIVNFIDELCTQVLLSNLVDSKIFIDFLNSMRSYLEKDILIYYTIQKFLMKKFIFYMDQLNNIFTKFGKPEEFIRISNCILESFYSAQQHFCTLDMEKAANVEVRTQFIEQAGSKIFNIKATQLEKCGIIDIFKDKIANPMVLLYKTIFSKIPDSLSYFNQYQFKQLFILLKSIKYFEFKDIKNSEDDVITLFIIIYNQIYLFLKYFQRCGFFNIYLFLLSFFKFIRKKSITF